MNVAANLLRHETSPYLLQHADNPVHWRPWGAAALADARTSRRPILLSIGYAACHWCHVMAHESFEDPDIAAVMNQLYVNIKVDREERPDIDHLYMSALHALGEQGGWPLTMFLTPDAEPFWGGTYFPPEPRWGRPSFRQVLEAIAAAWRSDHATVRHNRDALAGALARMSARNPGAPVGAALLDRVGAALLQATDPAHGGLHGAPKFPNPPIFRFLWQQSFRTGNAAFAAAVHLLLERISQGGIYDHLGGGYARYATDAIWLVPHFEKMLYDNAQLLELLALAHAARPLPLYAARAAETIGWLTRDMTAEARHGRAAFAASEDADSEGAEGRFYVWSDAEIDILLGADSAAFKAAYDVTRAGNWEGHTILRRITPPGDAATEDRLADCRNHLLAARARRVRPGRDDKVLADWNGLAVAALCRAAAMFREPAWRDLAERVFGFILAEMSAEDGRIQHAWRLGRVTAAGLIDDQAAMARAALALFEATGAPAYLAHAIRLAEIAEKVFGDGAGGFYTTAADAADVPLGEAARPRTIGDNATPSGSGLMAEIYARLYHLTGADDWRRRAEAVSGAFSGDPNALSGAPTLLAAADFLARGAAVVVAGDPSLPATHALLETALAAADPATIVLRAADAALDPAHPGYGKSAPPGEAAAFVCRNQVCGLPLRDPASLADALAAPA